MSKNINQIVTAASSILATDKLYLGRSPFGATDDRYILGSTIIAQFGAPYTAAALTRTNDTNVTLTLGGTPATALLQATSLTLGWSGSLAVGRGGTGNTTFTAYGVICAGTTATGAFQNVSGVGSAGEVLTSNGAAALPTWQAAGGGGLDPSTNYEYFNDLVGVDLNTNLAASYISGSGAAVASTATGVAVNHPGVISNTTGITESGFAGIKFGANAGTWLAIGGGELIFKALIKTPSTISDGTDTYNIYAGLWDNSNVLLNATNGIGIFYQNDVQNGKWSCVSLKASSGTYSTSSSNPSFTADAWTELKMIVNADGTSVSFYIDNVLFTSAAITTDLPDTVPLSPRLVISKAAGTNAREMLIDYVYVKKSFTTPR